MAAIVYDIIVIGAGVEGSATAYYSAKQGAKTLLLEQFALPHSRGSSHGQSRIIRKAYNQYYYANMMEEAYQLWFELEKETSTQVYLKTGLLNIGKKNGDFIRNNKKSLDMIKSSYQTHNSLELQTRFPQFRVDQEYSGVFDPNAGVLFADKALGALQSQFRVNGGTLRDAERVLDIKPGEVTIVTTSKGSYKAHRVIIAAGPWTNNILQGLGVHLPIKPQRIEVLYWKEKKAMHQPENGFPTFIYSDEDNSHVYGLPAYEYPGLVKVCSHVGPVIDPDNRDDVHESWVDGIAAFIGKFMPHLETKPSIKETCIYSVTPDEDFILDKLPSNNSIFVAAGFSGHGFKLAPVVGKLMYELATGKEPSFDMTPFRIDRFAKDVKSKL